MKIKVYYVTTLIHLTRCEKPDDLAMLAAQQYFVDWGTNMTSDQLSKHLPQYIPDFCITVDKPITYWTQLTLKAYEKVICFTQH